MTQQRSDPSGSVRPRTGAGWAIGAVVLLQMVISCRGDSNVDENPEHAEVEILMATAEGASGLSLVLGICNQGFSVDIEESEREITISVTRDEPESFDNEGCSAGTVVQLDDPVGDRLVIDGSTGKPVPQEPAE